MTALTPAAIGAVLIVAVVLVLLLNQPRINNPND